MLAADSPVGQAGLHYSSCLVEATHSLLVAPVPQPLSFSGDSLFCSGCAAVLLSDGLSRPLYLYDIGCMILRSDCPPSDSSHHSSQAVKRCRTAASAHISATNARDQRLKRLRNPGRRYAAIGVAEPREDDHRSNAVQGSVYSLSTALFDDTKHVTDLELAKKLIRIDNMAFASGQDDPLGSTARSRHSEPLDADQLFSFLRNPLPAVPSRAPLQANDASEINDSRNNLQRRSTMNTYMSPIGPARKQAEQPPVPDISRIVSAFIWIMESIVLALQPTVFVRMTCKAEWSSRSQLFESFALAFSSHPVMSGLKLSFDDYAAELLLTSIFEQFQPRFSAVCLGFKLPPFLLPCRCGFLPRP